MPSPKLPATFSPKVFDQADGRLAIVKRRRERIAELLRHSKAREPLRRQWAQRASFTELLLETAETNCLEGVEVTPGSYFQLATLLDSLYRKLGISAEADSEEDPGDKLARHLEGSA